MRIYLIDSRREVAAALSAAFDDGQVVACMELSQFLRVYKVECVVSPANSFGIMDGGFDLALTQWFGKNIQERVQARILHEYAGEQPVGSSFIVETGSAPRYLIHTPTMRYPKRIVDSEIIYHCMRSTLLCAYRHNLESLVIPAFGAGCGAVPADEAAYWMRKAYNQVKHPPNRLNWSYVQTIQ